MEATHASTRNQHKESETLHFVLHLADLGLLRATNKGQNMQPALTRSPLWLTTLKNYSADFTLQIKHPIFTRNYSRLPLYGHKLTFRGHFLPARVAFLQFIDRRQRATHFLSQSLTPI